MLKFKKVNLFSFSAEQDVLSQLQNQLESIGVTVVNDPKQADVFIVVGGDGTILHKAKIAHQLQKPIIGVNLGRIGFLADVEVSDFELLKAMLEGFFVEDQRQVMQCTVGKETHYAVNEVMINKAKPTRMIKFEVYVDDQFVYEQTADGMIVATATGSSAYALSAGGQLLHPGLKALSLVPVSPSKITSRPMSIRDDAKVELVIQPFKDGIAALALDAVEVSLGQNRHIHIQVDPQPLTILHPMHYDYYQTLKHKLNWQLAPKSSQ